ncbi:hypothetical protein COOONC_03089, partial [Cooperia oncophora]
EVVPPEEDKQPVETSTASESREDTRPVEEPFGPDDFLDDFGKQFIGYTFKELQRAPIDSPQKDPEFYVRGLGVRGLEDELGGLYLKYLEYQVQYESTGRCHGCIVTMALAEMRGHADHWRDRRSVAHALSFLWKGTPDDEKQFILENFPAFKLVDEYAAKQP